MKNSTKKIKKYLSLSIIGIFIAVSAIPLYEHYRNNTYVSGNLGFKNKSLHTINLDYRGKEIFDDYEIGVKNISGNYTATLNERLEYIEFIVQLENLPEDVHLEDVYIQEWTGGDFPRDYSDYNPDYIKFEYVVDNDTDTIKIIGNDFNARYQFDDFDRVRIGVTLAGLQFDKGHDTRVWVKLGNLIIN